MPMIETINLTKNYGELVALNNLNMSIDQGACYGFIGPNGAGKTTTIKILATLLKPTWGEARIDGKVIGYQNPQIRPLIGYVPDFMGAYEDMVVYEYLEFFAAAYNINGQQRKKVVGDVLELTDLGYKQTAEVNSLSRGMQQRLSIARVLLHDPKVLLMDEPLTGLDPVARQEMASLMRRLGERGAVVVVSSHVLHELETVADQVVLVHQGRKLAEGSVAEIRAKMDDRPRRVFLRTEDPRRLAARLFEQPEIIHVSLTEGGLEIAPEGDRGVDPFLTSLGAEGLISEIKSLDASLESVFGYLVN